MEQEIEINPGEIVINFNTPVKGQQTFAELGLKDEDLLLESGLLRLVFNMERIADHRFYRVPTIEISYKEEVGETHWQCDFNGETILDKMDHHGHSTVILLNRDKLTKLIHHHENKLVLHAEFPQAVHLLSNYSFINFFN